MDKNGKAYNPTNNDQGFEASLVVQDCVHQLYVCASC